MSNLYIQDWYICQNISVFSREDKYKSCYETIKYKVNLDTGLLEEVE